MSDQDFNFDAKVSSEKSFGVTFAVVFSAIGIYPPDAFKCFMGTDLDMLIVSNTILMKENQDPELREDYKDKYELD